MRKPQRWVTGESKIALKEAKAVVTPCSLTE